MLTEQGHERNVSRQEFYAEGRSGSRQEYGYHSEGNVIMARKKSRRVSTHSRGDDYSNSMDENDSEGDFDSDGYGYSCVELSPPPRVQAGAVRKKSKSDGNISSRRTKSHSNGGYMSHRRDDTRSHHKKKLTNQMSYRSEQRYDSVNYYSDGHWIAEEGRSGRDDHQSARSLSREKKDDRSEDRESGALPRRRLSRQERRRQSNRSRPQEIDPESDNSVSEEEIVRHWKARGRRHIGRKVSSAGLAFRRWPIKRRWTLDREVAGDNKRDPSGDESNGKVTAADSQQGNLEKSDGEEKSTITSVEDKLEASDADVKANRDKADTQKEKKEEDGDGKSKEDDAIIDGQEETVDDDKKDSNEEEDKEVCQVNVDVHEEGNGEGNSECNDDTEKDKTEEIEEKKEDEAKQGNVEDKGESEGKEKKDSCVSSSSSSSSVSEQAAKCPRRGSFFLPLSRSGRVGKVSCWWDTALTVIGWSWVGHGISNGVGHEVDLYVSQRV